MIQYWIEQQYVGNEQPASNRWKGMIGPRYLSGPDEATQWLDETLSGFQPGWALRLVKMEATEVGEAKTSNKETPK